MKTDQEVYNYLVATLKRPEMYFVTKDALLSSVALCVWTLGYVQSHQVYHKFAPDAQREPERFQAFLKENINTTSSDSSDKSWCSLIMFWINAILLKSNVDVVFESHL